MKLSPEAIHAADPKGMVADILQQGPHLADALWRADSAGLGDLDSPGGLVVCGMGGSAVGGDLAAAAVGGRLERPMITVRDYTLPSWVGPDALVLCASYSGGTEETLAACAAAAELGARRVAMTTGGALAEAARSDGVPVIGVPSGLQPRAAVAYMTVGALQCATAAGAAPDVRAEIEAASTLLATLAAEWGPDAPEDSAAKALAHQLADTIAVVYGAGPTAAVASRWKTQINENAKRPAFSATLPEADHNEICGWEASRELARLSAVFLGDRDQDPRLRRRIEPTATAAAAGAVDVERVEALGETAVERIMSLVFLGDLISAYMAVLEGVDPTPVEAIDRFKAQLS